MDDNLKAFIRLVQKKLDGIGQSVAALQGKQQAIEKMIQGGVSRPLTQRERALAAARNMQAAWLVIEKTVSSGNETEENFQKNTDSVGRFVVDRIRATWRATSGNSQGMYGLVSSAAAGTIDHTSTNLVDFTWELIDGRNNLNLANSALPSDLLARNDGDGFPAGGIIFEASTPVKLTVTPLRAWPSDGVLSFIFSGIQLYDQIGAP